MFLGVFSHVEFNQGNIKYLRMKFYIEGPFGKATVNLEKKKVRMTRFWYVELTNAYDWFLLIFRMKVANTSTVMF